MDALPILIPYPKLKQKTRTMMGAGSCAFPAFDHSNLMMSTEGLGMIVGLSNGPVFHANRRTRSFPW
jgi:hypothetical protein